MTRCRTSRPSATPCPTSRSPRRPDAADTVLGKAGNPGLVQGRARKVRQEECCAVSVEVVITGMGATTPLGGDAASTWDAMLAGKSGVSALTQDWAAQLTVRIAAQLAVEPTEV